MANNRNTYQQEHTVSIKREKLIEMAVDPVLSKKDLKVLIMLLSQLDGYSMPKTNNPNFKDPLNFKKIDVRKIASTLEMDNKTVKKSIRKLHNEWYIEEGSNDTIKKGYRLTF